MALLELPYKKELHTELDNLIRASSFVSNKKQAIECLIEYSYLMLFNIKLFHKTRHCYPGPTFKKLSFLYVEKVSKNQVAKEALVSAWLWLVKCYAESKPFSDLLTPLYGEYTGFDKKTCQHLTPSDISSMIAKINLGINKADYSKPFTIADPCGSGCGSLILASLQEIYETKGRNAIRNADILTMDICPFMSMASVFQIEIGSRLHNIPFGRYQHHHGNAITDFNSETFMYGIAMHSFNK